MSESRAVRWSRYLIYAILATLPLERIPSIELASPLAMTIRISQVAGLLLILLNLPLLWRSRGVLLKSPWRWLGVFWVVCLISALLAENKIHALAVLAFTMFVGALAWTIALRFEAGKLKTYMGVLIGSAVVVCVFGLYQFFGDLMGLSTSLTGLRPQYTSGVFGFPRIQSTGLEPLYFDNFLLIPIALIIASLPYAAKRLGLWLALVFFSTIIFLNVSRGAIVALLVLAVAGVILALGRRNTVAAGAIAASVVAAVIISTGLISIGGSVPKQKSVKTQHAVKSFAKQATNVSSGESTEFRALSRQRALQVWEGHWFLGVGPGNFGLAAHKLDPNNFADDKAIVNNEPLEILAETGVVGIVVIGLFAASIFGLLVKAARAAHMSPTLRIWIGGLAMALLAICVQYQTFSTLYITHVWVALGLFIGVMMLGLEIAKKASKTR